MPITDLLTVTDRAHVGEAITKPIAYTLSPRIGELARSVFQVARSPRSILSIWQRQAQHQANREIALQFLERWNIELVSVYGDRRSGFELLAFKEGDYGHLVFLGSDDALDWWCNLSDRSIGWPAFTRNRDAVVDAIYELLKRDCTHLCARGHSLGGALAQYAYLAFPSISNCVTYQPAAIAMRIADTNPGRGFATTHYLHRDDIIPPLSIRKTRGWLLPGRQIVFRPPDRYRGARRIVAHTMPLMPLI
jgi:hypothetical protein